MTAPKLRFREFTDEWKVGKLDDITEMIKDGTHGSFREHSGGIPLLSAKDIRENKIFSDDNPRRISQKDFDTIHKTYSLKNGDVLLTIVGSLGRSAIVHDYKNNYTLQRSVAILRMNSSSNSEFVLQVFQTKKFQRELKLRENKAIQSGIYLGELTKVSISLPSLSEQQKIAKFLFAVDARIDAASRKLELLRDYKTAVSRKIFSREIRFPGFSDEWQMRKLSDILSYKQPTKYIVHSTTYSNENEVPVLTAGKTLILGYTDETDNIYRANRDNPVIIFDDFTTSSQLIDFSFKVKSSAMKILIAKQGVNIRVAYESLEQINFVVRDHKRHWIGEFQDIKVKIPSLSEQTKIANFLIALDLKISTENAILTDMKCFKKALLKEMLL